MGKLERLAEKEFFDAVNATVKRAFSLYPQMKFQTISLIDDTFLLPAYTKAWQDTSYATALQEQEALLGTITIIEDRWKSQVQVHIEARGILQERVKSVVNTLRRDYGRSITNSLAMSEMKGYGIEQIARQLEKDVVDQFRIGSTRWRDKTVKELVRIERKRINAGINERLKGLTGDARKQLKRELRGQVDTYKQTIQNITKQNTDTVLFNRARARRIAQTEVVSAGNFGKYQSYRQMMAEDDKLRIRKQWLARLDQRTRDSHAVASGQIKDLNNAFDVGGFELMYPGDPSAPIAETVNCRCQIVAVQEGEEQLDVFADQPISEAEREAFSQRQ